MKYSTFAANLGNRDFSAQLEVEASTVRVLVLSKYGRLGASSRLRGLQFRPWLEQAGLSLTVQPLLSDALLGQRYTGGGYGLAPLFHAYARRVLALVRRRDFDLIWIEKEALPWLPAWLERGLLKGVPYVLDYDDAQFHVYDLHHSALVRFWFGRRLDALMAGARLVTAGNEYLAERARRAGASWVETVPTVVDLNRYGVHRRLSEDPAAPLRIVWIGSPSTVGYLSTLGAALASLSARHEFMLRVIGGSVTIPGVRVECLPWTEDTEAQCIAECDVGIMPLLDSPWERGKCGYKLIQYMACGLPVIASPVGVNNEIVRDNVNGFLARDEDEWISKLSQLLDNGDLRRTMGTAGRGLVESLYCVQTVIPKIANMFSQAATSGR
ncbi:MULTISPECIES: glycosyltransferase family 4 protein [Cupriavidus]|uniref:glycosyltransferase family 4 protein n=1 Tax=Cupriavidus TaxID=106589 RepID=UPI000A074B99|nr:MULTISPECIES: glycosyltransferase family 4 protein [Cupriavidus]QYY27667.1 glycosyltransferase family 4 protein [Cupriavidus pinatubonensis]TPQ38978.1 glycosyl transferase family 1 [Cupriavidus pinatubonensis]